MRSSARGASFDLPLALLAAGFFLWLGFQTFELVRESQALAAINRGQDTPLQDAARLHQATDALAGDTATLAQTGNEGAKLVVEEMARQNVVLKPPAAGPAPVEGQPTEAPK